MSRDITFDISVLAFGAREALEALDKLCEEEELTALPEAVYLALADSLTAADGEGRKL